METKTMTEPTMSAARACSGFRYGANAAHSGDLGRVQGRSVSAAGLPVRERTAGIADFDAPTTGSVSHRLERPPV